jgi:hypothetical protein
MGTQIDTAVKRARAYWFVDGFTEIATGGLFVLLASALFISRNTSQMPFLSWFLSVTGEIIIVKIVSILAVILGLWWLKDHFTYPRTGFVRNRITATQIFVVVRSVVLFLLLPIIILLTASVFFTSMGSVLASMPVWFPVGLGLIWAVFVVLAGEWMGLIRFRLLGGMTLLTGMGVGIWQAAMGLPNVPATLQPTILQPPLLESIDRTLISLDFILVIFGLIVLFSGVATFLRYRKENPQPYTEGV